MQLKLLQRSIASGTQALGIRSDVFPSEVLPCRCYRVEACQSLQQVQPVTGMIEIKFIDLTISRIIQAPTIFRNHSLSDKRKTSAQ